MGKMQTLSKKQRLRRRNKRRKRKENRAKSLVNDLPQEIVVDILSRLPLKSVVRSMCVCKGWRSSMEGYTKSLTRQKVVALTHSKTGLSFQSIDQQGYIKSVRKPWKKIGSNSSIRIDGSCNGLLLLEIDEDLLLWNPLTGYSKKVLAYEPLRDEEYRVVSGLCFDSSSNEYKVVMALSHSSPDYGGEFVVVGSFRNKTWTRVSFSFCASDVHSGPVLNENLHWFSSKNHSFLSSHQIVFFDPLIDEFREVPMPEPKDGDGDILLGIGVLDGCLCMARFDHPGNFEGNVEVLVMKEYGMQNSWAIMFSISNSTGLFHSYDRIEPLCSTKNDEVLVNIFLRGKRRHNIWACNSNDNSHREIPFSVNHHCLIDAVMYEESLETPPNYSWEDDELRGEATYDEIFLCSSPRKLKKVMDCWVYMDFQQYEHSESKKLEVEVELEDLDSYLERKSC
ncbi:unnamed protein product [Camellia sinensis]